MQKHHKVYREFFGFGDQDRLLCECGCGREATEIHHIDSKGMGGTSIDKDYIENLAAVNRVCHEKAHASKVFNKELRIRHLQNVINFLTFG